MAKQAHTEWIIKTTMDFYNFGQHEYILSLDTTDSDQNKYYGIFKDIGVKTIINPNRSIVDAVNRAAEVAKGDIMIVISDDFGCPENWNKLIEDHFKGVDRPMLLHVNDTIQQRVCTLPIINRQYYEKFGYIYHPHYVSMFADDDLTECAKQIGAYKADFNLTFEHRHFVNGKNKRDRTYDRENSKQAWDVGKRVFQARKQRKFDIA